uniref:Uncharacterized protein n=1 Tax=Escherichia coli TaxID=562 RepID=A0A2H5C5T5_ECOLX|nr:hypothetical protein PCOV25_00090 [Escherichia coli]AVR63132.1 hypothetical protein p528-3_00068 [Escherichia coli]
MSGGTVPLRLISLILLFSLIPPARASYVAPKQIWTNKWDNCFAAAGARYQIEPLLLKAICKRTARAVLTGMCYSAGSAMRHGSSSLTRLTGQSAMTPSTWRR